MSVLEKLEKKHGRGLGPGPQGKLVVQMPPGGKPVRGGKVSRETKPSPKSIDEDQERTLERFDGKCPQRIRLKVIRYYGGEYSLAAGSEHQVVSVHAAGVRVLGKRGLLVQIPDDEFEVVHWAPLLQAYSGEGPEIQPTPKVPSVPGTDAPSFPDADAQVDPEVRELAKSGRRPRRGPPKAAAAARIDYGPPSVEIAAAVIADLPVTRLPLTQLVRHPKNRHPTAADVDARAESMRERGQLEPLVVHLAADELDDKFEILSGETRWLAAKKLGWKDIAVRVAPQQDEQQALALLALFNAQRQDLNPIEKAESIKQLCDGGLTREAAAKIHNLESGAAASNLLRLLELPEVWRSRIASGELPQSWARPITSIVTAPRLMAKLDESWKKAHRPKPDDWEQERWESRSAVERTIDDVIRNEARSLDPKQKRSYSLYDVGVTNVYGHGDFGILFDLTEDVRKQIAVAKITIEGKEVEVATDAKAFEALQKPLVKAALLKKSKGKASSSTDRDAKSAKPKDKSPAEIRAAKKKADEQLQARIAGWRSKWIKSLISAKLLAGRIEQTRMAAAIMLGGDYEDHRWLSDCLEEAIEDIGVAGRCGTPEDAWTTLEQAEEKAATANKGKPAATPLDLIICEGLKRLLAKEDRDPRRPQLAFEFVDAIAAEASIDLAEAWRALQKGDERTTFEEFLLLHTGEQLDALAGEWGIFVEGKPKTSKVQIMSACAKTLPLPSSIAPLGGQKKRKRGAR